MLFGRVSGSGPSPIGPAWGCGGSGPVQLALAIVLAVTDRTVAERSTNCSKWGVVAPTESDRWELDAGDIRRWLERAAATDEVVRMGGEDVSGRRLPVAHLLMVFRSAGRRWRGRAWAV